MVATGEGLTVIVRLEVCGSVHEPASETVNVYVVVEVGDATGFAKFGLFNPAAGDHN
jgi:hypothetical protein